MSEWSSKSCFIASAPTKTAITHLRRDFSTHCILSWPSRCSYSRHFRCERIVPPPRRLSGQLWMRYKLSFEYQPYSVPVELIQDSLILNQNSASASAPLQRSPPNLPPPRHPPLPALDSSGAGETRPVLLRNYLSLRLL
ncbi:hypothetical protein DL96DRAFT_1817379 [Flagelloscypha sp. PMI_526]|nr:hypothetical protein DL96DRAFT_1817379 [Flagelloscypha sp. PMI_526]